MADKKIKVHRQVMILPIIQRVKNDSLPKAGFKGIISNDIWVEMLQNLHYSDGSDQLAHPHIVICIIRVFAVHLTFWSLSTNSVSSKDS